MDISPLTVFILLSLQNLSECRAGIKYGDHKVHQTGHQRPRILPKTSYCSYNNRTYEAGEKFSPDPCTFCHCPRHSNRIQCAIQDCRYKSNCVRYNKLQGQCCGQCVEIGCKHSDGNIYNPNQTVVSNKCEICKCPPSGGRVECNQIKCPTINCVDPVKIEGECCEKCPNGPNCWLGNEVISGINGRVYRRSRCALCQCPRHPLPFWMKAKKIHAICSNICA